MKYWSLTAKRVGKTLNMPKDEKYSDLIDIYDNKTCFIDICIWMSDLKIRVLSSFIPVGL